MRWYDVIDDMMWWYMYDAGCPNGPTWIKTHAHLPAVRIGLPWPCPSSRIRGCAASQSRLVAFGSYLGWAARSGPHAQPEAMRRWAFFHSQDIPRSQPNPPARLFLFNIILCSSIYSCASVPIQYATCEMLRNKDLFTSHCEVSVKIYRYILVLRVDKDWSLT